jgi:hypothetical protein
MDPENDPDYNNAQDALEAQLRANLREDLARALQIRRPLLTHLNADTTWLLSLPIPTNTTSPDSTTKNRNNVTGAAQHGLENDENKARNGRGREDDVPAKEKVFFHILIDPWLRGSQSDVAHFVSRQWHAHESAVQTIAEVEDLIDDFEALASSSFSPEASQPNCESSGSGSKSPSIDAIVVSHEFTDHMHRETLLEVSSSVPVFAPGKAAGMIRSWAHFDTVVTLGSSLGAQGTDWRKTSVPPLPEWLGISRLGVDKVDLLYYHSAIMFAFLPCSDDASPSFSTAADENAEIEAQEAEAIIYTPHGISPTDLQHLPTANPPIHTLALLHGLHDIRLGPQLNLGAHNGLKVQRLTGARYWIATHDEVKKGGGLVSWFLKREVVSVREALEREMKEIGSGKEGKREVRFMELGNGESLILE